MASAASVAHLEQNVAALQSALVVAMEEVDQLRSQVFQETGKLQREFRESLDVVVRTQQQQATASAQRLFSESGSVSGYGVNASPLRSPQSADVGPRLEYIELALRTLQERRDATPAAVDVFMQQTRRANESLESAIRQVDARAQENIKASEASLKNMIDDRIREAVEQAVKRQITLKLDGVEQQEAKVGALTNLVGHIDRRLQAAEEGLGQLDSEQHEVTAALQQIREAQKRVKSPTRRDPSFNSFADQFTNRVELENIVTEQSAVLREEVLQAVDSKIQRKFASSPTTQQPAAPPITAALDHRATQQEVLSLRQDVARCVAQIERLMDENQRLGQQQHTCLQSVQRLEHSLEGVRDRLELDLKTELQRFDTVQKTFFSRQDQILNAERHQLGVKITADLQRMHQRQMEDLQKAEFRRLDDIRNAQVTLREDFNSFIEKQRDENDGTNAQLDERLRKAIEELKIYISQEVSTHQDLAKKATTQAGDELRKVATKAMDELKRVKQAVEEQSNRTNDHQKFLQQRVQQVLDAEVHRFDHIAFEFTAKLQKQVDEEVTRVVAANQGNTTRELEAQRDVFARDIKNIREELISLRSSLQAIAAPSNALLSLDSRVDVLRRDVLDLHESLGKVQELELRVQNNISQDARILMESLKSDILREVGQHIIRFDQTLVELAQENAVLKHHVAEASLNNVSSLQQHQQQHPGNNVNVSNGNSSQFGSRVSGGTFAGTGIAQSHLASQQPRSSSLRLQSVVVASNPSSGHSTPVTPAYANPQPNSIFGGPSSSTLPDLVMSAPRGSVGGNNIGNQSLNVSAFPTSRFESPDKSHVSDRYYTTMTSGGGPSLAPPTREDPLVGVFSEYQSSP